MFSIAEYNDSSTLRFLLIWAAMIRTLFFQFSAVSVDQSTEHKLLDFAALESQVLNGRCFVQGE